MDRETLRKLWIDWWEGDIWIAPWSGALEGVTAEQAARQPQPGRHSIWQLVTHVVFWRTITFERMAGMPGPTDERINAEQFAQPARVDEASWREAKASLRETHERIVSLLADASTPLDRLRYHLAHDAYHLGQIMYVRALLGMRPVV